MYDLIIKYKLHHIDKRIDKFTLILLISHYYNLCQKFVDKYIEYN